ncbi:MAG TPA: DNA-binding response regulator [Firmicutes bacterium]|nr:DNA-binding response regulator [Bacillota bacterium]
MKKIMIVEDDKSIREELKKLLKNAGYDSVCLEEFENAETEILESNPDLILLDINLPYINGETLLQNIRKKKDIPVMMVTSRATEIDEVLSMSYGADDFITKPYNPTILLLRIGAIFKRMEHQGEIVTYQDLTIYRQKGIIKKENTEIILTKNEMIILNYLLNNQNRIVTRDELMTDLWNNNEYINDNALTVNISRLRNKLKSVGYEDAIETRKGIGYILI